MDNVRALVRVVSQVILIAFGVLVLAIILGPVFGPGLSNISR